MTSERYICKTQIDVQCLIDVQSSNWRPILKYMTVSHIRKSTFNDALTDASNDVTSVKEGSLSNDGEATQPDSR